MNHMFITLSWIRQRLLKRLSLPSSKQNLHLNSKKNTVLVIPKPFCYSSTPTSVSEVYIIICFRVLCLLIYCITTLHAQNFAPCCLGLELSLWQTYRWHNCTDMFCNTCSRNCIQLNCMKNSLYKSKSV